MILLHIKLKDKKMFDQANIVESILIRHSLITHEQADKAKLERETK